MTKLGLGDVTENCTNNRTNFEAAKDMGATWAFLRATTTGVWVNGKPSLKVDTRFYKNYEALKTLGFDVWLYSWFDPRVKQLPAQEQADFFLTVIDGLEYSAVSLDVEDTANIQYTAASVMGARNWLDIVREELGIVPGIYTYPAFVDKLGKMTDVAWMGKYPLDHAQWTKGFPLEPFPWWPGSRRSWQYTDYASGAAYGFYNADPRKGAYRICLSVSSA